MIMKKAPANEIQSYFQQLEEEYFGNLWCHMESFQLVFWGNAGNGLVEVALVAKLMPFYITFVVHNNFGIFFLAVEIHRETLEK